MQLAVVGHSLIQMRALRQALTDLIGDHKIPADLESGKVSGYLDENVTEEKPEIKARVLVTKQMLDDLDRDGLLPRDQTVAELADFLERELRKLEPEH